ADPRDRPARPRRGPPLLREAPGQDRLRDRPERERRPGPRLWRERTAPHRRRCRGVLPEALALARDARRALPAHDADPGKLDDQRDRASRQRASEGLLRERGAAPGEIAAAKELN